jgi:hypothetical protein
MHAPLIHVLLRPPLLYKCSTKLISPPMASSHSLSAVGHAKLAYLNPDTMLPLLGACPEPNMPTKYHTRDAHAVIYASVRTPPP